jgi:hypothetical protein
MTEHVRSDQLRRFVRGQSTAAENLQIVAHLLGGCAVCSRLVHELLHPTIPQGAYDEPFDRFVGRLMSERRSGAVPLRFLALP